VTSLDRFLRTPLASANADPALCLRHDGDETDFTSSPSCRRRSSLVCMRAMDCLLRLTSSKGFFSGSQDSSSEVSGDAGERARDSKVEVKAS
jgi:hypothetical protein